MAYWEEACDCSQKRHINDLPGGESSSFQSVRLRESVVGMGAIS